MRPSRKKQFAVFLVGVLGLLGSVFLFLNSQSVEAGETSQVTATITISVCGNNIIEADEECDGTDLGGETCKSLGYAGGTLSCQTDCTFKTTACTSGGGGGGGGGGGSPSPPAETEVNFSGRAYPLSKVGVLKDGQVVATSIAGPDAKFYISLSGLSPGDYNFSLYGEDSNGRRSSLFTFSVYITDGVTTNISGVFITPTIDTDKSEVKRGENIAILGQSPPLSEVTIAVNSEEDIFVKTFSDQSGTYLYNLDTVLLAMGRHLTQSKAALQGEISSFSNAVTFLVGNKTVFRGAGTCPVKGDLNDDCRVNLVDFSIAAYWYKKPISAQFAVKETDKLNSDGKISLVDFSIMAFYWTG